MATPQPVLRTVIFTCALVLATSSPAASAASLAPDLVIRSWSTAAGLPQSTVTAIVQTRDGYLWLGTRDGLARFDGVRFTVFGLQEGLQSVDILTLLEDSRRTLWIGTSGGGLARWKDGRIQTVITPDQRVDTVNCLEEDAEGRLWVGTQGGLRLWQDKLLLDEPGLAELAHTPIRYLMRDRAGTMWISTMKTLMTFRDHRLEPCPGPPGNEEIVAYCLLEDQKGRLWASVGNGRVLCRQSGSWNIYSETNGLPFAYVTSLAEEVDGTIWAGSLDDGLYRFEDGRFEVMRRESGLSADDIRALRPDREGNLWVGTRTGGLNRLSRRKLVYAGAAEGLTNDFTRSVAETSDGKLWVGTTGGSLYEGGLDGFKPFRPIPLIYFYAHVESVLAGEDGSLWWGASHSLLRWKNGELAGCYTNEPWVLSATVTALQHDGQGGLWIGTSEGRLVHYQAERFTEFPKPVARGPITALACQTDGAVWVGSVAGGLRRIREAGEAIYSVTNGLLSDSIRTLYLDGEGTLWIGTAGGGLSCWRKGKATSFKPSQGLSVRTVSQIIEDDHGFLWLGAGRGILKVRKKDLLDCADGKLPFLHPRSYGINDGMPSEECSGGFCPAGLKLRSGLLCFSTVRGLVFLDPHTPSAEAKPPEVVLEEIIVNGQKQPIERRAPAAWPGASESPARIVIAPGQHELELHYTAIQFAAPEKIGFRYQLEGIDRDWVEAGGRRTAYYQRLPPGNFVFRARACNADGVWADGETTLAVIARPFFWETDWFHAAATVTVLGSGAGGFWLVLRRRYKRRLERLQMQHAIEKERLRISQDMHDHIGSLLTHVSQLSDMGQGETADTTLTRSRFERIGTEARVAVQALDEIVWATNPKNDNLGSFAEYVSRFTDEFFEYTRIRCWQDVPATLPPLPLRADVRHTVFLAIREALNNVLKHSGATEVRLRLALDNGSVRIEVEDNGRGFLVNGSGNGNGLGNMRARLGEAGGRTELSSDPGHGTKVGFVFPVKS